MISLILFDLIQMIKDSMNQINGINFALVKLSISFKIIYANITNIIDFR